MSSDVFGVIAPHPPIMVEEVGGSRAEATAASSEAMVEAARALERFDPDTIVIMSPHSPAMSDAFIVDTAERYVGSLAQFGAPHMQLAYRGDPELAFAILEHLDRAGIPAFDRAGVPSLASGELDHGVLVPMSFLDRGARWPIVDLSLSFLPLETHADLGRQVSAAALSLDRRIAFIASGDCSHRLTPDAPAGYSPRAKELDQALIDLVSTSDFAGLTRIDPALIEAGGECGLRSFIALGGAADPASARLLAYEGPWGVGYLTAVVNEPAPTPDAGHKGGAPGLDGHEIVKLARGTIEGFVRDGRAPQDPSLHDAALPARAGAFVSLHMKGQLRGCIGTIAPVTSSLAEEVVRNAIEASTADPRFSPVTIDELELLDIKVDVLHPPEPATEDELDPSSYGVIVRCGPRRALLLPDLEGVDTVEQQLAITRRKAGIGPTEPVALERFRVDRYA
jgi:AmmeMemoRadiSam system protein A